MEELKQIIEILTKKNKTIATMESCTGGALVNNITNIEGASEILKFSAITYSNEFKIKMGVNPQIIAEYSVYSFETAQEMALNISKFANSNYGIGITGKLNRIDKYNLQGADNIVYISIYDKDKNIYHNLKIEVTKKTRQENKVEVIEKIAKELLSIINLKD